MERTQKELKSDLQKLLQSSQTEIDHTAEIFQEVEERCQKSESKSTSTPIEEQINEYQIKNRPKSLVNIKFHHGFQTPPKQRNPIHVQVKSAGKKQKKSLIKIIPQFDEKNIKLEKYLFDEDFIKFKKSLKFSTQLCDCQSYFTTLIRKLHELQSKKINQQKNKELKKNNSQK